MAGYYEQLQAQLERAAERGLPRRGVAPPRWMPSRVPWRLRADWIAIGLALACSVGVVLVFTQVGVERAHRLRGATGSSSKLAVIRNYAPGRPPAMGGQLFCDATLTASGGAASPAGTVVVNTRPPTGYVYRLTASGLTPSPRGEAYEVWLRPETREFDGAYVPLNGEAPVFLGAIAPTVGSSGKLAAQGRVPQTLTGGSYRILITLQPTSAKAPGRTVIAGDLPL